MDDTPGLCLPVQHLFCLTLLIREGNQGAAIKHQPFVHHPARGCQRHQTVPLRSARCGSLRPASPRFFGTALTCAPSWKKAFSFSVCIFLRARGFVMCLQPARLPLWSLLLFFLLHVHLALVFDELCGLDGCNLASAWILVMRGV